MVRNVLISGAGVSGLALAFWLDRAGFDVTLVERNEGFRRGGQAVDIRGVALDVMQAMGLLDQARAMRTQLKGMSSLDANGVEIARTTERTYSAGRLDGEDVEVFRDALCELLMGALGDGVRIVYGDSIDALAEKGEQVKVTFASGNQRLFDLVIGADGVYSRMRRLWFNDEAAVVKNLDVVMALFTVPNLIDLRDWQLAHRADGVGYVAYPGPDPVELRVCVGYGTEGADMPRGDVAAQKALVASKCAKLGGRFPEFLQAMHVTDQFQYNELAQIRMPKWSKGRVVLAGDAAHCSSPFSGQGTSLALVGALVLARALANAPDNPEQAFAMYEERMRPYVQLNQDLVDLTREEPVPDEQMTRAKFGIELADLLDQVTASPAARKSE